MGGGKGGGDSCATTGYRYYTGLHLVFCQKIDQLIKIGVGDNEAWPIPVNGDMDIDKTNLTAMMLAGQLRVAATGLVYTVAVNPFVTEAQLRLLLLMGTIRTANSSEWAWPNPVSSSCSINMYAPKLFGGDEKEGGVQGKVDVCFGEATQAANAYLQTHLGSVIPAFRGLFALIVNHCMVASNNPYIKQWWVCASRTQTGWRDDISKIMASDGLYDMNAIHIIREALTNTTWGGLGYPSVDIDDDSFQDAAYTLGPEQEAFGLSLVWAKNTTVEDFIGIILKHINAVLYVASSTGLLTIKLIRNDYTPALLPVLDKSNILKLSEFYVTSVSEAINQVTINYVDRDNTACGITVQDLSGISRANGTINAKTIDYVGIVDPLLASKVASRELTQSCLPLTSGTFEVNRTCSELDPGSCFTFNWEPLGISNMIMRVISVDESSATGSMITLKAVRDVFGFGSSTIISSPTSMWINPVSSPQNALNIRITELTYWQFVKEFMGDSAAVLAEIDDTSTFVISYAKKPSADSINYEMWDRNQGAADWIKQDTDSFPYILTVSNATVPEVESVLSISESMIDTTFVSVGLYAYLEDEIVSILSVDNYNKTITVARGVIDTVPVNHSAGSKLWFIHGVYGLDRTERASGEVMEVRLLPATSMGRLSISSATNNLYTCTGRMMRPLPPGNVKINNLRWPSTIGLTSDLVVTWAHRDRLTQTVTHVKQDEGNFGPEAGTTYNLRVYYTDGTPIHSVTGLTGTTYTFVDSIISYNTDSKVLAITPDGLWKLDETSGTTVADSAPGNHPGTYRGTYTLGAIPLTDPAGSSVDLLGTGCFTINAANFYYYEGWTWGITFNYHSFSSSPALMHIGDCAYNPNQGVRIWIDTNGKFTLTYYNGTWYTINSTYTFLINTVYSIAMRFNSTTSMGLFVNGVLVETMTFSAFNAYTNYYMYPPTIGGTRIANVYTNNVGNGRIDSVWCKNSLISDVNGCDITNPSASSFFHSSLRMELESERAGLKSLNKWNLSVTRA